MDKVDLAIKLLEENIEEIKQTVEKQKPVIVNLPLAKTLVIFNITPYEYEKIKSVWKNEI